MNTDPEARKRVRELEQEVRSKSIGYVSAALGLVAGLAWNDAITTMIERLFPIAKDTVFMKFAYAGLVTVAVIILIQRLDKLAGKKDNT